MKLTKYDEDSGEKQKGWEENFELTKQYHRGIDDRGLNLLTDKGVYPYDFINSWEKIDLKHLPSRNLFYSQLSKEHISLEDYDRAVEVWNPFQCQNFGEYHDLYLITDVLLLSDVFQTFRATALEYYGLDPAHYYTLPNYAWDAMLKKTGITLDLITDMDMYFMVEHGLRGGMVQVSHRHAKANNSKMDSYNPKEENSWIKYLDANNLYGLAMSMPLPCGELTWDKTLKHEGQILSWKMEDDFGYILTVDLEYPEHLHDEHADYPLAPELMKVRHDMVSETSKQIYKEYHQKDPPTETTQKLILNMFNKSRYTVHIANLQYYLLKGMNLTKIHQLIKFRQKPWLKNWIDFNTDKRKKAKNDFEKDCFKIMANSVFGKTMENVRNHIDFELVNCDKHPERGMKIQNSPKYKNHHIINESLVGYEKEKSKIRLDKPIYVGFAILELSKLHMYRVFYDIIKPYFRENARLLYTDTDSLILHIKTKHLYQDIAKLREHFDTSNFPKEHELYSSKNKKVPGLMKMEEGGKIITEFAGLAPKLYALRV